MSADGCSETAAGEEVGSPPAATASSTSFRCGGNSFPRFAARRRIPRHARGESEYRGGASGSKIAGSEHAENASASLGQSEVSSIKSCPPATIPDPFQLQEDRCEVSAAVASEQSGNILPKQDSRAKSIHEPRHVIEQPAALSCDSGALAGDAQVLTREPARDHVHARKVGPQLGHVGVSWHIRPSGREHVTATRVNLHLPRAPKARALKPGIKPADASEQTAERQCRGGLPARTVNRSVPQLWQ